MIVELQDIIAYVGEFVDSRAVCTNILSYRRLVRCKLFLKESHETFSLRFTTSDVGGNIWK